MNSKNIFAENLKKYMKIHKKTRRDVCKDLGFSYFTFTDWVNGRYYPRMDKVEMLADYFGIKKSDLIEEKELSANAIAEAELHFEMTEDEDYVGMYPDFKKLDASKRKIVMSLVHDLAETKTEA